MYLHLDCSAACSSDTSPSGVSMVVQKNSKPVSEKGRVIYMQYLSIYIYMYLCRYRYVCARVCVCVCVCVLVYTCL